MFFGIILSKAEIISWYRIHEMFRFESFHMFGVIGSAVVVGIISIQIIKRTKAKNSLGEEFHYTDKKMSIKKYLLGGSIFGLGWAMIGACPGPMFILLGKGVASIVIVILSAILGTFIYGLVKNYRIFK